MILLGKVLINDSEEMQFIQKELSEIGLDFPDFILKLVLNLHWKFMETKGLAPKNSVFDKKLAKLKKEMKLRFDKKRSDSND
jgi:hypothetical protein